MYKVGEPAKFTTIIIRIEANETMNIVVWYGMYIVLYIIDGTLWMG